VVASSRLGAYVDESVHITPGLYVLAAVLGRDSDRDSVREALTGVRPGGAPPHWRVEADTVREKLVDVVSYLPVEARVYACRFASPRRTEAARARALHWLVGDLDPDVGALVLDRRDAAQDVKDRRVLTALLGRPSRLPFGHVPAATEPFLWVADVVAGAVSAGWVRGCDYVAGRLDRVLSAAEAEPR
jgi:hypothetical protein